MPTIDELLANLTTVTSTQAVALEENARVFNEEIVNSTAKSDDALDNLKIIRNQSFAERFLDAFTGGPETSQQVQLRRLKQAQVRAANAAARKQSADNLANTSVRSAATAVQLKIKGREAQSAAVRLERSRGAARDERVARAVNDIPFESLQAAIKAPTKFNLKSEDIPELRARLAGEKRTKRVDAAAERVDEAADLQKRIMDVDPRKLKGLISDKQAREEAGFADADLPELLLHQNRLENLARSAVEQKLKIVAATQAGDVDRIKSDKFKSDAAAAEITDMKTLKELIANGQPDGTSVVNTLDGPLSISTASLQVQLASLQKLQRAVGARTAKSNILRSQFDTEILAADTSLGIASRIPGLEANPALVQGRNELLRLQNAVIGGQIEATPDVIARVRQLNEDANKQIDRILEGLTKPVQQLRREFAANGSVSVATAKAASGEVIGNQEGGSIHAGSADAMKDKIATEIAASSGKIVFTKEGGIEGSTTKKKAKEIVDGFTSVDIAPWKTAARIEASKRSWGLIFTILNNKFDRLGFGKFLSPAGNGQLSQRYTDANNKFSSGLIGQDIATLAKEQQEAGAFDENVDGLEFITDTIKALLRSEEYQRGFAELIKPVGPNDAAVHQLILPTSTIGRTNEQSIFNILEGRKAFAKEQVESNPIERAQLGGTNPMMNIFKALGSAFETAGGKF